MLVFTFLGGAGIARGARPPQGVAETVTGFISHKARALLSYLVLNRRSHSRDVLAGLLWGALPQQRASGNLRVALSNLRDLFPDCLNIDRTHVAFDAACPYWLDVEAFESLLAARNVAALQQATALYRGPLLEGFWLREAPDFEEWLLIERERLHQMQLLALHRLTHQHSERGEYIAAIETAGRLLELDPWREETHRELMQLLALTGQRSAALAQYRRCCRLLQEELNLEPLEETTALYERIKRHVTGETESDKDPAKHAQHYPLPFTGRGAEHARVIAWWQQAQRGAEPLLLVEGEAGIGKTRLAEETLRYIESKGATVLRGRCYEFSGGLPYQPLAEALRAYLRTVPAPPALAPVWLAELTRLLPDLEAAVPVPARGRLEPGEGARQRLFEAVARFLAALAHTQPVLLFLDDLHWADPSTLDLLHYLVRSTTAIPLSLVGAYRPEEVTAGHPLTQIRRGLSRDRQVVRLRLERLSAAAVVELARNLVSRAESTALGAFLYKESEGNPFILTETLYTLQEQGVLQRDTQSGTTETAWIWQQPQDTGFLPIGVQDVILQRVERLSTQARELLTLAAVIGRYFDLALLQAAAGSYIDVGSIVEEWLTRRLITRVDIYTPDSIVPLHTSPFATCSIFDFTHDKIRATVYHAASPEQRHILHRKVAGALEKMPQGVEAGLLAYHWEQAADTQRATEYLLRAGDHARLLYAAQEASDYYHRALGFLEQQKDFERAARTWMKLGLTYHNAFDFKRARESYAAGFVLWQHIPPPSQTMPPAHTLRVRWEEPRNLDPLLAPDAHTSELIAHLFSGLVELNAELAVVPDVAQRWEVSDDGRALTFHLRAEARWSDGVPVTAEDFVYAWRRALEPANGPLPVGSMAEIAGAEAFYRGEAPWETVGVKARDAHTLEVTLHEPSGYFLYLLAHTPYYPVPRHVVEAHGAAWSEPEHFVSNGPFTLQRWERGQRLVLTRHNRYHGRFTGNLRCVELYALPEPTTRLDWYIMDKLDVLGITHFPNEMRGRARQRFAAEYFSAPRLSTCYLVFDARRAPFADARVRQALALVVDREALADSILQGHVAPATGGLVPQGMPGHVPGIALPYAPERARQLLAEAGHPEGHGFPRVHALAFRAMETRVAYLQAQWSEQLAINITWDILEWGEFLAQVRQSPPALFPAIWTADYPDPDDFLRVSRRDHWAGWQHAEYDTLVEQARRDLDQAARLQRYAQAERFLVAEVPILPLTYERDHLLLKPWVRRYPIAGSRAMFWKDTLLDLRNPDFPPTPGDLPAPGFPAQ